MTSLFDDLPEYAGVAADAAQQRKSSTSGPAIDTRALLEGLNDQQREGILSRIPMGAMGSGEDIGAAVVFLASKEAGYVTGQTLHVNGGMAMP